MRELTDASGKVYFTYPSYFGKIFALSTFYAGTTDKIRPNVLGPQQQTICHKSNFGKTRNGCALFHMFYSRLQLFLAMTNVFFKATTRLKIDED